MKKYTLFWLCGYSELVYGNSIEDALKQAGYNTEALDTIVFYGSGDARALWKWDEMEHSWKKEALVC